MMTEMECAASRNPEVSAMLTAMSKNMPRYFPILWTSSRGSRLIKGLITAYQTSSAADTGAAFISFSTSTPSRRRKTRFAMWEMASLWVTITMVQP